MKSDRPYKLAAEIPSITHSELVKVLDYNRSTGVFTWKRMMSPKALEGSKAGTYDKYGYVLVRIFGRAYKAHRLAWFYVTKKWPKKLMDHRNGIRDDNSFANLRQASHAENSRNQKKKPTSPCKGVFWCGSKKKWRTVVKVGGINVAQKLFEDESEAKRYVKERRIELHGEFANHG